jgi:hypothetical protein
MGCPVLGRRQRRHPSLVAFRCSRWSDKDKTGRDALCFIQHQTKACGDVPRSTASSCSEAHV